MALDHKTGDRWIVTGDELRELYPVGAQTLKAWREEAIPLPATRNGRRFLYDLREVIPWHTERAMRLRVQVSNQQQLAGAVCQVTWAIVSPDAAVCAS